jgi:hypothetical protein
VPKATEGNQKRIFVRTSLLSTVMNRELALLLNGFVASALFLRLPLWTLEKLSSELSAAAIFARNRSQAILYYCTARFIVADCCQFLWYEIGVVAVDNCHYLTQTRAANPSRASSCNYVRVCPALIYSNVDVIYFPLRNSSAVTTLAFLEIRKGQSLLRT